MKESPVRSIGPIHTAAPARQLDSTPLLPDGFKFPASRNEDPSQRLRRLLAGKPYVFGPGVYDPMGAELVMYHGFDAVYFSGYSFAIGHLGTTDMDIYSSVEIADGARRTVSALRKFQLTMAMGDPDKGIAPVHLEIPPVVVDMDAGYGNLFNVQRTIDLYVRAGVAAAHLEDQVMPKRCGHIAGKALISADEFVGKLKMMRNTADDLGELGVGFIFITLALQHAAGHGMSVLLEDLKNKKEEGYMSLQRKEWEAPDIPTKSHHLFTGVPYHQHMGQVYGATRLSEEMDEHLEVSKVV